MFKQKKHFRNIVKMFVCAMIIIIGTSVTTGQAQAISKDESNKELVANPKWYSNNASNSYGPGIGVYKSLQKCVPGVSVLGEAFVHGGNGVVDKNSEGVGNRVPVQCYVDSNSERDSVYIQGKKIDRGWIVRGNIQHLYNMHRTPSIVGTFGYSEVDKKIGWPSNAYEYEFCAVEGEKFQIVGYDKDWVYIWSTGSCTLENGSTGYCRAWLVLNSHPAGFYKIDKDNVWIDLYKDNTYAPDSEKVFGEGYATIARTKLYHKAGKTENGPCYEVKVNTKFEIVDPNPVTVTVNGKDKKYYKVRFKGKNDTYYMGYNTYYVYVESKYINVYKYDANGNITIPKNPAKAYIYRLSTTVSPEFIYTAKDTKSAKFEGALGEGAKFYVDADKSDADWAAVQFNNEIGYVQTSRITYYIDEMKLLDIKGNKYVLSWGKVPAKVTIVCKDKSGKKISDYKTYPANTTSITLDNAIFKDREGYGAGVTVLAGVAGTTMTSDKTATIKLLYPAKSFSLIARGISNNNMTIAGVQKDGQLQYSSSSSFKTYKNVTPTSNSASLKNLTKNKYYYFRFRNKMTVNTDSGKKAIYGDWSKTIKAKTTNVTMKTPSIKTPKGSKKFGMIYWKKFTGHASKYEIVVATNKGFTKNVKKTVATKSRTSIGIDKLKAKTKYYVKMRSVYTHYSQTYYSKWSKIMTFKTK